MLSLAILAGCGDWRETPENASHWNPRDLSDSLANEGVPFVETPVTSEYYDGAGDYHYRSSYDLSFDATGFDLSNDKLWLTGADFSDFYAEDDGWICDDYDDTCYYGTDVTQYGSMGFSFQLNSGVNCYLGVGRYAETFYDKSDVWQLDYNANHPERLGDWPASGDHRYDYYDCYDLLPVDQAAEGINSILR